MAWYTSPSGVTCVAAYDFVGASSLADSYINEANPGTNDAAPGVAPTWAYGTGVTFNGTTQYLTTGVIAVNDQTWSMIIRYTGATASNFNIMAGVQNTAGATPGFFISPNTSFGVIPANGANGSKTPGLAGGVLAVAGNKAYRNGADESITIPSAAGSFSTWGINIGAVNRGGAASQFRACAIQAAAIYSGTLTLADVVAITAAMNALPAAAAAKGLPVIAHHHRQIFGG